MPDTRADTRTEACTVSRTDTWDAIACNGRFDVIVVGGGINGIGAYRDLALQGLRVLLVEARDFASGCSAAPSRMIHGGLRYLENGEFDLVRESLEERDALLRNAPHMVQPLPTLVPLLSFSSGLWNSALSFLGYQGTPATRGLLPVKLGLSLYDFLCRRRRQMPAHKIRGRGATLARWPDLLPDLRYSAGYYDAWISHPERLCIELLLDVADTGGLALNYARLDPVGAGFELVDQHGQRRLEVTADVVVNATGAWVDQVAQSLGAKPEPPMVSGTRGSHLILDNPPLAAALGGHMVYFENTDGRVCILFPYLGKVLAGSTDIRVEEAGQVGCTPQEQDYILGAVSRVFPGLTIGAENVIYSYSGIRPLPSSDEDFTGRISRGHDMRWREGSDGAEGAPPQLCMIGGKWTTFRAFGAEVTDAVLARLGRSRHCDTQGLAIGGGLDHPGDSAMLAAQLRAAFGLSERRAAHLADHYGTRAYELQRFCETRQDHPLAEGLAYSEAELVWIAQNEMTVTLADLVLRRSSLAITGCLDGALLDALSDIFGAAKGLCEPARAAERTALVQELVTYHGLCPKRLTTPQTQRRKTCV